MVNNFLDRLLSDEKIEVKNYTLDKRNLSMTKGKIGSSIFISRTYQDTISLRQRYELTFWDKDKFQTVLLDPLDILPNRILGLLAFGVDFDVSKGAELSRFLHFQKQEIPVVMITNHCGWVVNDKESIAFVTKNSEPLTYGGDLAIQTKGMYEEWNNGIKDNIIGNIELELVLATALATIFIGYDDITLGKDIGSSLINLYSDSSQGKTTAAMLALSCFGEPTSKEKGTLMRSFSSTKNSMMKSLSNNHGVMLCFDDISAGSNQNISELLYGIGNGRDKDRLTESSQMNEGGSFTTQVLVTGEESIRQYAKKNGGISVRYIEFEGLQFTKSAEHSEKIKRFCSLNYGFAALKYAAYLLDMDKEVLSTMYDSIVLELLDEITNHNGKTHRYVKRLAAIALTATLLNDCFGWNIDVLGIRKLLMINLQQHLQLLNYKDTVLNLIISYIVKKQHFFSIDGEKPKNSGDFLGEINTSDNYVKIEKSVFEEIISELGLPSATSILKEWKQTGITKTESDRLYYRDSNKSQFVLLNVSIDIHGNQQKEDSNYE